MRAEIEQFLRGVEGATAKVISDKIGHHRLDVSRELNEMVSEGLLEREMKQHLYVYWLSHSDKKPPSEEPAQVAVDAGKSNPAIAESISKNLSPVVAKPEIEPMKTETDIAFEKLAEQMRELLEVFGLPATMTEALDAARTMVDIATSTAQERDALRDENKKLKRERDMLQVQIDQYKERQGFETWFKSRPEAANAEHSALRERMWEAWLERSKFMEAAA